MEGKKIAVLTSGGDAPGMNAAIRAVVRCAINAKMCVVGVRGGYSGLINDDIVDLNLRSVSEIINKGGTVLYTGRCPEFYTPEGVQKASINCKKAGIDCLVVIGGDGSFRGMNELIKQGVSCVGIPATIDNDVPCSEYSIGFDTATNTAMEMIDKLRDTAQSHENCSVVEVMGRHCGKIALKTGVASGATAIVVPEVPYDFTRDVLDRIVYAQKMGRKHFIVIVTEGICNAEKLAETIFEKTGINAKPTVLGHVQRGGSPTLVDRVMATRMGYYAVKLMEKGVVNKIVVCKDGEMLNCSVAESLKMQNAFNNCLYQMGLEVSI